MEAFPIKVRELVLEAYDEGLGTNEIAKRFKVSADWARRVRRRWLEHNIRTVIQQKHGPDRLMDAVRRKQLEQFVAQTPDATLEEFKKRLTFPVSISTIARTLNEMKLTLKKSPCMPASRSGPT
jgi:transposase